NKVIRSRGTEEKIDLLRPYSCSAPQVSATGDGVAFHEPGAGDGCGGDLPRGFLDQVIAAVKSAATFRHAAPRYECFARSVARFSPDFRARRCAWTTDECSDDGDYASTIRASLSPSQRVSEVWSVLFC